MQEGEIAMNESKLRQATGASWQSSGKSPGANPAENYERFFVPVIGAPLAADLIKTATLRPGERVLDVACGTGVVARLASARVGPSGAVAGLDINPAMLAVARSATASGTPIEWHEASAESIPLPDESFDVVLCQLGLQFVPDKAAALGEMRRVLVPGGRVLLNLPAGMPPLFAAVHPSVKRHLGPEAAGFLSMVFSLSDPDEIRSLLDAAKFREVSLQKDAKALSLPAPADFLWQYLQSTPLAAVVSQASDDARAELEQEVVEKWQEFASGDGMAYQQDVITAIALK
jgi:ubiquinone/menaquinone biosynthesis C-methylase UbiE